MVIVKMSEETTLDLEALLKGGTDGKDGEFDGYEFIVELVDDEDDDATKAEVARDDDDDVIAIEDIKEESNIDDNNDEEPPEVVKFSYEDGFLTRSKHNVEEQERKKQEELVEKRGLFKCSICMKFFMYRSKIHHHLVHDHGVDKGARLNSWVIDEQQNKAKTMIPCHVCGKTYQMKDSLARHIKVKHTNFEKIKCPLCPVEFTQKSDVERHIRRKHAEYIYSDDKAHDFSPWMRDGPYPLFRSLQQEVNDAETHANFDRRSRMMEDALKSQGFVINRDEVPETASTSSSKINDLSNDFRGGDVVVVKTEHAEERENINEETTAGREPKVTPFQRPTTSSFSRKSKMMSDLAADYFSGPPVAKDVPECVSGSDVVRKENRDEEEDEREMNKKRRTTTLTTPTTTKSFTEEKTVDDLMTALRNKDYLQTAMKCSICNIVFGNVAVFVHHLIKKHGIDKIQAMTSPEEWMDRRVDHKCKSCNFSCKNKEDLKRHIEIRHKIVYNWAWEKNLDVTECSADHTCHICGKSYMEEADLHAHLTRFCNAKEQALARKRKLDDG